MFFNRLYGKRDGSVAGKDMTVDAFLLHPCLRFREGDADCAARQDYLKIKFDVDAPAAGWARGVPPDRKPGEHRGEGKEI
jgi:hypothetical protein